MSWLQLADGIAPARALEINSISMAAMLPVMFLAILRLRETYRAPFSGGGSDSAAITA